MTATTAAVRAALLEALTGSAVKAVTHSVYNYDLYSLIVAGAGAKHDSKARYQGAVNYLQYITKRNIEYQATTSTTSFEVEFSYFREADIDGTAHTSAIDIFETVINAINSVITADWNDTIAGFSIVTTSPTIDLITLTDKLCWRSDFSLIGHA